MQDSQEDISVLQRRKIVRGFGWKRLKLLIPSCGVRDMKEGGLGRGQR